MNIDHERLLQLFWEYAQKLESVHTFYLDSIVGYQNLHKQVTRSQLKRAELFGEEHEFAKTEFQDTCGILYKELGDKDLTAIGKSPVMKQGEAKERLRDDGGNTLLLGTLCIVDLYAYWEEYLRFEIGKGLGVLDQDAERGKASQKVLNKHVSSDIWGDLRHMRNAIVHNNGVATSDIVRCKRYKWFEPGEGVELGFERMRRIFLDLGWYRNELHRVSMPRQPGIRVPKSR